MDNVALVISLIAMVAFLVYLVRGIAGVAKKREGTKTLFKRSFIALAVFFVGFIVFGMTTEPPKETAKEPKQEQPKEKKPEKTAHKQEAKPAVAQPKEKKEEPKKAEVKKEEPAKKEGTKNNAPLMDGENGVLADDVFVALGEDKTNYEEMFKYITANNKEALERMILEGKVVFAPKGTPITVVDRGFINAKIEIIKTGQRGWVPVEYLARSVK
ncbi:hypothetical protein AP057_08870 [Geobacillus sp. Sah69]|uniref:hypothetical protein n=1 Tax=unclassified Geobacillus TaxID=2642459 RepID=UPI00069BC9FE|nr:MULTISPECIES: hypothetical protein [unclassified Geobacillus]KQC46930.1 hypothetical protein AP057_08870 [Geobacillus sp. Sah69]